MRLDRLAISILTDDEKSALMLQHQHEKSSWEAGEIIGKSHYKYLEIKQRAEKFIRMFQDHFMLYEGELIPDDVRISEEFKEYLMFTIMERQTVSTASANVSGGAYLQAKTRKNAILAEMAKLKQSKRLSEIALYSLIMEFDRYNNFRILPKEIQEPSAFKRRNSTRHKKHLKIMTAVPKYTYYKIIEKYQSTSPNLKSVGWLVILSPEEDQVPRVIRINASPENLHRLSEAGFYVFGHSHTAEEFSALVLNYASQTRKDPKRGLQFWPQFRQYIQRAINYDDVNNIIPSRKNLTLALENLSIFE